MLFWRYDQSLFLVDEFVVLVELEKKHMARIPGVDYDYCELTDMDNSVASFILKTWSTGFNWGSVSPRTILLFSDTTREKPQSCTREGSLK